MKTSKNAAGHLWAMLLAAGLILVSFEARTQEISDAHLAAAREAVAVSQSTAQMDIILPNMGEQIKQTLIGNRPDAAGQIAEIVDEITVSLAPRRGDLETEVAKIYAGFFTEEELATIVEFYRTDAGRKLVAQTPAIARSMDQAARVWASGLQRDLQRAVQEKIQEAGLN